MNNIYLIVGRSGSGKDTVVDYLCKHYGYKRIVSYTTRPPRNARDKHIFVTDEEFDRLKNIVAYTEYNGYRYCATAEQVEDADLYIIDPAGVEYFKKHYKGRKGVRVIGLECDLLFAFNRMRKRGDSLDEASERVRNDNETFKNYSMLCDYIVNANLNINVVANQIQKYIEKEDFCANY